MDSGLNADDPVPVADVCLASNVSFAVMALAKLVMTALWKTYRECQSMASEEDIFLYLPEA